MTDTVNRSAWDSKDAKYVPSAPIKLSPNDVFTTSDGEASNFSVGDYWSWAYSDLKANTNRGSLGEFLVAQALGLKMGVQASWEPFDLQTPRGTKVEVKTSGYMQAWAQSELYPIQFGGLKAQAPDSGTEQSTFNADIYVFCVQTAQSHAEYDSLNTDQWRFYVARSDFLKQKNQKTMRETTLRQSGFKSVTFSQIAQEFSLLESELHYSAP